MMKDERILNKLQSKFIQYGIEISERSSHFIKFKSSKLIIILRYNPREKSNTLWLGEKEYDDFIEIDKKIMHEFFNSKLKIRDLSNENFAENVLLFFNNEGEKVLKEPAIILKKIREIIQIQSEMYTSRINHLQYLEKANKAWNIQNYNEVIVNLDKVNQATLSPSFKKKYKIALQRLNKTNS